MSGLIPSDDDYERGDYLYEQRRQEKADERDAEAVSKAMAESGSEGSE